MTTADEDRLLQSDDGLEARVAALIAVYRHQCNQGLMAPPPVGQIIALVTEVALVEAADAARANWRLVVNEVDGNGHYDDDKARHWSGASGWLRHRARKIAAGDEPDWPDAATSTFDAEASL